MPITPTELELQQWLDKHPEDHLCRMVLADWLEENGDVRAAGYRALGLNQRRPFDANIGMKHETMEDYMWFIKNTESPSANLPQDWMELLPCYPHHHNYWPLLQPRTDRRGAEDAASLAFSLLPAERQAELLEGVLV